MIDGAVVALQEIVDADLPVRLERVRPPVAGLHELVEVDAEIVDQRRELAERLREGPAIDVGVHEHHGAPGVDLDGPEAELLRIEA